MFTAALESLLDASTYVGPTLLTLLHLTSQWDKGSIKGFGWSEDEKLLVVTEDGTVRCYYDLQGDFTQFTLGNVSQFAHSLRMFIKN